MIFFVNVRVVKHSNEISRVSYTFHELQKCKKPCFLGKIYVTFALITSNCISCSESARSANASV